MGPIFNLKPHGFNLRYALLLFVGGVGWGVVVNLAEKSLPAKHQPYAI